jgi:SSS family solute:Na+ symporter
LVSGTVAAAIHHGLTLPAGSVAGIKGAWLGAMLHRYPSEMAQNFWTAIFAFSACLLVTAAVSLVTKQNRTDDELTGLVSSLTERPKDRELTFWQRPSTLAVIVLACVIVLNVIFW